jgi:hypothetical protein
MRHTPVHWKNVFYVMRHTPVHWNNVSYVILLYSEKMYFTSYVLLLRRTPNPDNSKAAVTQQQYATRN